MALTYQWLNKSSIRVNTEALFMASQEEVLNIRAVAHEIYHTVQDLRCWLCKQHGETVAHIISSCNKLAGTEYTKWHNIVASIVYKAICAEYNLEHSKDWWVELENVVRNDQAKTLWDPLFRLTNVCFTISLTSRWSTTRNGSASQLTSQCQEMRTSEQRTGENWQKSAIENLAIATVESQNYGCPSSCWCTRCNSWQVIWRASSDTRNDQQGWTAQESSPRNVTNPPAYS